MLKRNIKHYLTRAKELEIIPNFYLSLPYLELSNVKCFSNNGWIWIEDENWILFPPLRLSKVKEEIPIKKIWSDFENKKNLIKSGFVKEFLDWEYLFDPISFNNMAGSSWAVYRKNIRKWPKHHKNWLYCDYINDSEACDLVGNWLENKIETIQDGELLAQYSLIKHPEIHRKALYDENKRLVAINAWDENWYYINYRICIVKQKESFLDEFMRSLFYTDTKIQAKGKLINDGGIVGNKGLERFKNKMNPINKRKIYSLILKK